MRLNSVPPLMVALILVTSQAEKDPVKEELKKLDGTWTVIQQTEDGKDDPLLKKFLKEVGLKVIFTRDKYVAKAGDAIVGQGKIKVDPSKTPKTMDQISTAPADKGRTSLGIYKIEDDKLIWNFAPAGQKRPTEFDSKKGTKHQLAVLKRVKR